MYRRLEELDPVGAAQIHPHNVKRVVRALEYCLLSGEPFSNQAARSKQARSPYRYHMLCLNFASRETLYRRIDRRVDAMVEEGLLEEARRFFTWCQERGAPATAAQAIGYKELFPYFRGEVSLEQAVEDIKRESRRYAKRQITWFQREEHVSFLYLDQCAGPSQVLEKAEAILREQGLLPAEAQGGTT